MKRLNPLLALSLQVMLLAGCQVHSGYPSQIMAETVASKPELRPTVTGARTVQSLPSTTSLQQGVMSAPAQLPRPSFDEKPSAAQIDRILSDGQSHGILVLFDDGPSFRVRNGQGSARGAQDNSGIVALNDGDLAKTNALNGILLRHKFAGIRPLYERAQQMSEEEMATEKAGIESKGGFHMPNRASYAILHLATFSTTETRQLVSELNNLPFVKFASPLDGTKPDAITYNQLPSDPYFPNGSNWRSNDYTNSEDLINGQPTNTWWWNRHSFGPAWARSNRGNGALVAIIDDGYEMTNNDGLPFNTSLAQGWWHDMFGFQAHNSDVTWQSGVPAGWPNWHGTACASLFAAADNNGKALAGASPNVSLIPLKVSSGEDLVASAVDYAVSKGVRVISCSMHSTSYENQDDSPATKDAYTRAFYNSNVTIVQSAGNDSAQISTNGNYTGAIMVGSTDKDDNPSSWFSNYGTRVDIAAGGDQITLTSHLNGGMYIDPSESGTSLSAPLVAGAATMVSAIVGQNAQTVRDIVLCTADILPAQGKSMSGGYTTTDGLQIIRRLNADSATWVAGSQNSSGGSSYTAFMQGADDQGYLWDYTSGSTWWGSNLQNILMSLPSGHTLITWCNNTGGPWADSTFIFKNKRVWSGYVTGAPYDLKADGGALHGTTNLSGNTTVGWVNGLQWNLP